MKHVELLTAGVLLILLGTVAPTFARERHEQQAQAPRQEQAKPEEHAKPVEQPQTHSQQKQQAAQPQVRSQNEQKAQQQHAKSQNQQKAKSQNQQKAQQQQAKRQQKQQKAPQQTKEMSRQEGPSQRPQRTPQAEATQRREPALRLSARSQDRIPDNRFRSSFGRGHEFRIGSPRMVNGYSRFQYGGFWFGFVQPWPDGWYYTDDVYIDYVDGAYFVFNPYYPGVRIAISVVL